jgi:hypothetical protein
MPASAASSAMRMSVSGDCAAGFRMKELPAASAGPISGPSAEVPGHHGGHDAHRLAPDHEIASGPVGAISS